MDPRDPDVLIRRQLSATAARVDADQRWARLGGMHKSTDGGEDLVEG